ncbi:N,N-dimethylformamidase beta subunit family domain-containing protein [Micromonospora sp. HK10]|uniref:N,N-dimethylformamidase beta subunit family domain-containing protein n=1 Tax=Micromonospora sp. HK10 TaxID=1538294 RepID=UPI000697B3D5|nr:N,N-dimethylformamidase beta subunit family domain-containing protein [Micromonospora sp. HK10]
MKDTPHAGGLPRRRVLRDGAIIAASVPAATLALPESGSAAVPAFDPQQRFIRLVGGGNGVIYAIQPDGALLWYRHIGWQTGAATWASGSGRRIGTGWNQFRTVLGGVDGSLYGVRGDGSVHYHRYHLTDATTGAGTWTTAGRIGDGFDRYPLVSGFNGVIYGQNRAGDLFLHQYDPQLQGWTVEARRIGTGFAGKLLHADTDGVIYANSYGTLLWYRYQDGRWVPGRTPLQLRTGFRDCGLNDGVWFTGQGSLYTVSPDPAANKQTGILMYHRLSNYKTAGTDGKGIWINSGSARKVASGWTIQTRAALQGYANTTSVTQGATARIAVSTGFSSLTASLVRLAPNPGAPEVVSAPVKVSGGVQALPIGYLVSGCRWADRVQFPIPADCQPGLYAARLEGPDQLYRYVPFIVRPVAPTNRVAVLLPTFTYNAYNGWGGHNQYCTDWPGLRPLTLRRPSTELNVDDPGMPDHTLYSDLLLMRWMSRQGFLFDCYDDVDLHASGSWLSSYRVLVLGSHPEYWSEAMRQHLVNYQAGGGHIIYAGGNGIYERVRVDSGRTTVTYRRSTGGRDIYPELGLPASQLLGTNYYHSGNYAPYRVVNDHPLLAGTGLIVGSRFGATGYNGAASGWEVDGLRGLAGEAAEYQVIARGENDGGGAAMVFLEKPNGAMVFSASSITFAGALDQDPAMSTLFLNAFRRMLMTRRPVRQAWQPMERTAPAPAIKEPSPTE